MELREQLLAAGVTRWHIVETTRQQNLAEHHFNVAMIARRLGALFGLITGEQQALVCMALEHDMHEIHDGDVPSSTKKQPTAPECKFQRIIQLADKMEAVWFIRDRHVNRADVVGDCNRRLFLLIDSLPTADEKIAARRVMKELGL